MCACLFVLLKCKRIFCWSQLPPFHCCKQVVQFVCDFPPTEMHSALFTGCILCFKSVGKFACILLGLMQTMADREMRLLCKPNQTTCDILPKWVHLACQGTSCSLVLVLFDAQATGSNDGCLRIWLTLSAIGCFTVPSFVIRLSTRQIFLVFLPNVHVRHKRLIDYWRWLCANPFALSFTSCQCHLMAMPWIGRVSLH